MNPNAPYYEVSAQQHNTFFLCVFAAVSKFRGDRPAYDRWCESFNQNWNALSGPQLDQFLDDEIKSLDMIKTTNRSKAEIYAEACRIYNEQKASMPTDDMAPPIEEEDPPPPPETFTIFDN